MRGAPAPAARRATPVVPLPVAPSELTLPPAPAKTEPAAAPVAEGKAKKPKTVTALTTVPKEAGKAKAEAVDQRILKTARGVSTDDRASEDYRRAVDELSRGRNSDAAQSLRSALRHDPALLPARQMLAKVLIEQNALDEARSVLREGLKNDPRQLQWSMSLARLEIDRNDPLAAWGALQPSLLYATNDGEFLAFAGAVQQRLGKPGEAADYFRNALRLSQTNGRWWIGLGMALETEGHRPEAREAFRRALATGSLPQDLASYAERKARQPASPAAAD